MRQVQYAVDPTGPGRASDEEVIVSNGLWLDEPQNAVTFEFNQTKRLVLGLDFAEGLVVFADTRERGLRVNSLAEYHERIKS